VTALPEACKRWRHRARTGIPEWTLPHITVTIANQSCHLREVILALHVAMSAPPLDGLVIC
jgi:hypothetical protein